MLTYLCSLNSTLHAALKMLIFEHIQAVKNEFRHLMVHDPFTVDVTSISDDDDDSQSELLTLQTDGGAKMKFEAVSL